MLTDPDTNPLVSVRHSLADIMQVIQSAHVQMTAGRSIDLAGMDRRVGALCAQALALPPPMARETLPDLQGLREAMDGLIDQLRRRPIR